MYVSFIFAAALSQDEQRINKPHVTYEHPLAAKLIYLESTRNASQEISVSSMVEAAEALAALSKSVVPISNHDVSDMHLG